MIFDTDIFIWVQRGNEKAARLIDREETRLLSAQTYMELLQVPGIVNSMTTPEIFFAT